MIDIHSRIEEFFSGIFKKISKKNGKWTIFFNSEKLYMSHFNSDGFKFRQKISNNKNIKPFQPEILFDQEVFDTLANQSCIFINPS